MKIVIAGYTNDKVPGAIAKNEFGAGRQSIGAIPLICSLFGVMASSGASAQVGQSYLVTTPEEADELFGARSELARMCHAALDVPGVTIRATPGAEVGGAVAATRVIQIGGSWSTGGEILLQLDEEPIRVAVSPTDTPTTFGDTLVERVEQAQDGRLFCEASNAAGTITLTVFTKGERGNQHVLFLDASRKPAGMTVQVLQNTAIAKTNTGPTITVAGTHTVDTEWELEITTGGANGTAKFNLTADGDSVASGETVPTSPFTYAIPGTGLTLTMPSGSYVLGEKYTWKTIAPLSNGGHPFFGGSGVDDVEELLDATESLTNDYLAAAHNDAINAALIEEAVNRKADWDIGRLEFYFLCRHRGLADAISLGQTTMNDVRGMCLWPQNHVEHPSRTAARVAALASTIEGAQPNYRYDDIVIPGAAPHFSDADTPNRTTLNVALSNSVTPLVTKDGQLTIVRAITSRSLKGSTPDYKTYDRSEAVVPTRVRKELLAEAAAVMAENPFMGPDVGEGMPPEGTLTPRLWNSRVEAKLRTWAEPPFNWLTDVDNHLPESEWDSDNKRIMSVVPNVVKPQSHQLGIIVRQTAA